MKNHINQVFIGLVVIAAVWFLYRPKNESTLANPGPYPSIYEQQINDADHLILEVKAASASDIDFGYEVTNVIMQAITGDRGSSEVKYPYSKIPEKERSKILPGNILRIKDFTNLTFIASNDYPHLRRVDAYMNVHYITDGDYEVDEIGVYGGYNPPITRFCLKRIKDGNHFYGFDQNDFEIEEHTYFEKGTRVRISDKGHKLEKIRTPEEARRLAETIQASKSN